MHLANCLDRKFGLVFALVLFLSILRSAVVLAEPLTTAKYLNYSQYHSTLIQRSLQVSVPEYGEIKIEPIDSYWPSLRVFREAQRGDNLNMFWGPAIKNLARDDIFHIPIPLVKGLSGFRIMLIREGEQERFDAIVDNNQLDNISIGQGHGWIEIDIYAENGVKIQKAQDFQALFSMLSKGRFDALPIGADMVNTHLKSSREHVNNLSVEQSLIIYYPMPVYLFVSKKEPMLAQRLEYGLKRLIESGEMDRIFYKHYGETIKNLKLDSRKMFVLKNSQLMSDIPLQDETMWYRGEKLVEYYKD